MTHRSADSAGPSRTHGVDIVAVFDEGRRTHGHQAHARIPIKSGRIDVLFAEEVVDELERFLQGKNAEALNSLHEAGDELIALHSLNVPNTLHRNLLSTNAIENSFRNTRGKLGRVTRFRAETDQATRWLAFALTEVEKGFHRLSGYKDLPHLVVALEKKRARENAERAGRPGPLPSPTAPATAKAPSQEVENSTELQ